MSDARQEKGQALSRDKRIKRVEGALWFVPSQSKNDGGYLVNVLAASCTCPDHEERRCKCKHQWAVEFSQVVHVLGDGTATVTESVTVTRKTYPQNWPAYNAAQCEEKERVAALLRGLCDGILTPPQRGRGQRVLPLGDAVSTHPRAPARIAATSRRGQSPAMLTTAKGLSPSLQADRELSVIRTDPKLGVLIAIHPVGQPDGGWHMWIQPTALATIVRGASGASTQPAED